MPGSKRRYALFAGEVYYPAPGWRSFVDAFGDLGDAERVGRERAKASVVEMGDPGWWQVVDLHELRIVSGEGAGYSGSGGLIAAGTISSERRSTLSLRGGI